MLLAQVLGADILQTMQAGVWIFREHSEVRGVFPSGESSKPPSGPAQPSLRLKLSGIASELQEG